MSRSFRLWLWYFCLPAFFIVLVYPPKIHGYLNPYDEGLWLGLAQALIEGKLPYRDVFFHYGPILPWLLRLALHFFTPTLSSLRWVFWMMNVAGLLIIHVCLLRVVRIGFLRLALGFSLWCVPLAAHVLTIPMAARYGVPFASIFCWTFETTNDRRNGWPIYSGLFAALAFWVSQEVGTASLLAGLVYFSLSKRPQAARSFLMGVLSLSFVMALGLGTMGLRAYWQCAISETATMVFRNTFTLPGWGTDLLSQAHQGFIPFMAALRPYATTCAAILPTIGYAAVFIWTLCHVLTHRAWDPFALALAVYGSLTSLTSWTQPDRWHIYFTLSPAILLWGYSAQSIHRSPAKTAAAIGLVVTMSLFLTWPHAYMAWQKERVLLTQTRQSTIERMGISRLPIGQADGYEALVQAIAQQVPKNQPFMFYPYDGSIYFLTQRSNPTFFPVLALAVNRSLQQRLIHDMERSDVQWIVWDTDDNAFKGIPITTFLASVDEYIKAHFVLTTSLGPFRFLKRDAGQAALEPSTISS